jgi:cbb3-type cytochrome oxidase maturation protein
MSILALVIVLSLLLGAVAWGFFVWTVKSGQYDDPEGPKYRMLEDEEAEPRAATARPTSARTATSTPTPTPTATDSDPEA